KVGSGIPIDQLLQSGPGWSGKVASRKTSKKRARSCCPSAVSAIACILHIFPVQPFSLAIGNNRGSVLVKHRVFYLDEKKGPQNRMKPSDKAWFCLANWQTQFHFRLNFHCCARLQRQLSLPTVANSLAKWQSHFGRRGMRSAVKLPNDQAFAACALPIRSSSTTSLSAVA
ncbi:MAG TPA: hypothetical protein VGY66_04715, partial [Gemmataceae bacterium]|nr:hypothetical protein [Gemmataceae bacterium]